MFTIEKYVKEGNQTLKERLHIKAFKYSEDMNKFLSSQYDNRWQVSTKGLKSGIYAFAGGKYHNVKTLDASLLAHI